MMGSFKRKITQWAVLGFTNAYLPGFIKGTIYKGPLKQLCVPGLNCYSCPGALGSCPLGALQSVIGSYNYSFSFYVVGLLLAMGVVLGRFVCGFLCPFGLIQELLHKIPTPKLRLPRALKWVKYAVLIIFVIALPLLSTNVMGIGKPAFCQYICPAGTLEGGIPLLLTNPALRRSLGWLFSLKSGILIATVALSIFAYRFFCRVLCPLGAIYALFNRISIYGLRLNRDACIHCGACSRVCGMGVDPSKRPGDMECIRCGDCVKACPTKALSAGFHLSWREGQGGGSKAQAGSSPCEGCGHCAQRDPKHCTDSD